MTHSRTAAPELQLGHRDPASIEGGPDRPRCSWDKTVCSDEPTQVFRSSGGDADLYCDLHALLELRYQLDVHLPFCFSDTASHVVEVTALS